MKIGFRYPQWTANLRAERDLLRQLVPVISPSADRRGGALRPPDLTAVHDPHPNHLPIPDDYSIDDANADFFDCPRPTRRVGFVLGMTLNCPKASIMIYLGVHHWLFPATIVQQISLPKKNTSVYKSLH